MAKPTNDGSKGAKKSIDIHCPMCKASGRQFVMIPKMILAHESAPETMDTPFCIYKCPAVNCGYEELHYCMLTRKT